MKALFLGGSGSGKSKLAEDLSMKLGGKLIYVATMPIKTGDDYKVIERHHKLRAGKGFETLERQAKLEDMPSDCTLLLECISTFTANRFFSGESYDDWGMQLFSEIKSVADKNQNMIFVSVDIGKDGVVYDEYTEGYKKALADLNCKLAEYSDLVVESVYGIPNILKGTYPL